MTGAGAPPGAEIPARKGRFTRAMAVAAACVGNSLEWFDLTVYAFFSTSIAAVFFPRNDARTALLLTFGAFAVSYLARPLGAVVLGSFADRVGRKQAMLMSVLTMFAGTLVIAVMPGYGQIGIWAPVGLVCGRVLQGFSAGGEFGAATALLIEAAPDRRGFISSWQLTSQAFSGVLASLFGLGAVTLLSPAELENWGWRLPFAFGLLIGPAGLYIRRHVSDSDEFRLAGKQERPAATLLRSHKLAVLRCIGLIAVSTSMSYLLVYVPTYSSEELGLPKASGFIASLVVSIVLVVATPIAGHLSDTLGRMRLIKAAVWSLAVFAYPLFWLPSHYSSTALLLLALVLLGILKALYYGGLPALMADQFPVRLRAVGLNVASNLAIPVFGGLTPVIATWLIGVTGNNAAPGFYLVFGAVLGLICLRWSAR